MANCSYGPNGQLPSDSQFISAVRSKRFVGCLGKFSSLESNSATINNDLRVDELLDSTNVKYYGAVGDGVTDDTVAMQAALTANADGLLYFPPGTYITTQSLTVPNTIKLLADDATIDGSGMPYENTPNQNIFWIGQTGTVFNTTVASDIAAGATTIDVADATGFTEGTEMIIYSGSSITVGPGPGADGEYWLTTGFGRYNRFTNARVASVSGTTLTLDRDVPFSFDATGFTVNVQAWNPVARDIFIDGFTFTGFTSGIDNTIVNGNGLSAIRAGYCTHLTITNCKFYYMNGFAVRPERCSFVTVNKCYIEGFPPGFSSTDTGGLNYYALYPDFSVNIIYTNCFVTNLRHAMDGSRSRNYVISNNEAFNLYSTAIRFHPAVNEIVITANTVSKAPQVILNDGFDMVVTGNYFSAETEGFKDNAETPIALAGTGVLCNTIFSNNTVILTESSTAGGNACLRMGKDYNSLVCTGNHLEFVEGSGLQITSNHIEGMDIRNNYIVSPTNAGDNGFFQFANGDNNYVLKNISITDNTFKGVDFGCNIGGFRPIGGNDVMRNLVIKNNLFDSEGLDLTPVRLQPYYFGEGVVIKDNSFRSLQDPSKASIATMLDYSFRTNDKSIPVEVQDDMVIDGYAALRQNVVYELGVADSLPQGFTIYQNNLVVHNDAAPGDAVGRICTTAGTAGTVNGAITATTTLGSTTITLANNLDNNTGVFRGAMISVAGADSYIVQTISADLATITVDIPATASVAGAAVSYQTPVLTQYGRVADTVAGYSAGIVGADETLAVDATTITATDPNIRNLAAIVNALKRDLLAAGVIST